MKCLSWNPRIPRNAIAIHWVGDDKSGGSSKSSIGYIKDSDAPGRHYMHIADEATVADVAHEIGHGSSLTTSARGMCMLTSA